VQDFLRTLYDLETERSAIDRRYNDHFRIFVKLWKVGATPPQRLGHLGLAPALSPLACLLFTLRLFDSQRTVPCVFSAACATLGWQACSDNVRAK
jgi:hypothetical protein